MMLALAVAAAAVAAVGAAAAPGAWVPPTPQIITIDQVFDHFNWQTEKATFKERVLIYDGYINKAADSYPCMFYTGNEGDIFSFYNNSGAVFEHAERFGALVVFAEHRYFGESLPYGPTGSYVDGHVGQLVVEQALADYANVVRELKTKGAYAGKIGKVIAMGGSYGGMLSAWARMWWPQVFDGALAASAPVMISMNETSPFAFFEHITQVAAGYDAKCPDLTRSAWAEAESLAAKGKFTEIQQKLNLCTPPKDAAYVTDSVLNWARNAWTVMAMLNYPYPTNFLGPLPAWPMQVACDIMARSGASSPLQAMGEVVGLYYNGTQSLQCFDIEAEFYTCADATGCGGSRTDPNARSWDYLVCTELVLACGTNGKTDMFPPEPFSVPWLNQYCGSTWKTHPRPAWLPLHMNLENESYIIFSNGLLDPWSVGGIKNGVPEREIHTVWIADSAHHLDLRHSNPADPKPVTQARKQEGDIIHSWLQSE